MTTSNSVLYIAGWGRSGSTLLEELLADITGAFAAGEVERFWDRSFGSRDCQCGDAVRTCAFWSDVIARVALESDHAEVRSARSHVLRYRRVPRTLLGLQPSSSDAWSIVATGQRTLYESIMEVAGTTAIIDSSKNPLLPFFGRRLEPGLDLCMIHLVRHPAAVAHSWRRPKAGIRHTYGAVGSGANWTLRNLVAGLSRGSADVRVRYEDLADDPRRVLIDCADELGISILDEGVVGRAGHAIAGNSSRESNPIVVRDESWRTSMSSSELARVALVTWPLSLRYGYSLWR